MTTIKLKVPPTDPVLFRTLQWINSIRAQNGEVMLEDFPQGIPCEDQSCPIALALHLKNRYAKVGTDNWCWADDSDFRELPDFAADFVSKFDNNEYPQYCLEDWK